MRRVGRRHRCPTGPILSRLVAVERAEAYLHAHMSLPVPLSTLCNIVGRSERGLRNAFYDVHGSGPKRWMTFERLRAVRRVLGNADAGATSVTSVATAHGFFELGRFAALYKQTFGETPSETLRRRERRSTAQAVSGERTRECSDELAK